MQNKGRCNNEPALEYLFRPQSIAVVGVSPAPRSSGQPFIQSLLNCGYKGKIYPVGITAGEVFGLKIYPNLESVPDTIDYVISAIPAQNIPQLIADCATKSVKTIHLFTSGFSEIGDEEEIKLESQVAASARQAGMRIIGPNCMGLYCPETGLSFRPDFPQKSGTVGFVSQSGGNCTLAVTEGAQRGIYFSKVISYGNAADLNQTDFLEYLTDDPETKIITTYIEGVKDGRRFFQVLKRATRVKPVIVFKGGITEDGARAAASHTGAIAGSAVIWGSLLRQAGAIQVGSIEELIDMALLFNYLSPPRGKNVAVIGFGGGASVLAADSYANAGLAVPKFPPEIRQRLATIWGTEAGRSFKNPVDTFSGGRMDRLQETIRVITNYKQIDILIMHLDFNFLGLGGDTGWRMLRGLKGFVRATLSMLEEINKPMAFVLQQTALPQAVRASSKTTTLLYQAGVPVFPSMSRAANAISKFIQYHNNKREGDA